MIYAVNDNVAETLAHVCYKCLISTEIQVKYCYIATQSDQFGYEQHNFTLITKTLVQCCQQVIS